MWQRPSKKGFRPRKGRDKGSTAPSLERAHGSQSKARPLFPGSIKLLSGRKVPGAHSTDGQKAQEPQCHPCQSLGVPRGLSWQSWPRALWGHAGRAGAVAQGADPAHTPIQVTPTAPRVNNNVFSPCLQAGNTSVCSLLDKTLIRTIPSLLLFLRRFK